MIKVKVKSHLGRIKAKSPALRQKVVAFTTDSLLKKSEEYIPIDSRVMRDSGRDHSVPKQGKLIWKTPYVEPQWEYGTGRNNNATGLRGRKWALRAWADHRKLILKNAKKMMDGKG